MSEPFDPFNEFNKSDEFTEFTESDEFTQSTAFTQDPYLARASDAPETPSEEPQSSTKPRKTTLAIISVVVLCAIAVAGFAAVKALTGGGETQPNGQPFLSSDFTRGAREYWRIPFDREHAMTVAGATDTKLVVLGPDEGNPDGEALIAYGIAGNTPKKLWAVPAITSASGVIRGSFWGPYFLYGNTLFDAETGAVVHAPWPDNASVAASPWVDDAIACAASQCSAYTPDFTKMWSISSDATDIAPAVTAHGEYFVLLFSSHTEYMNAEIVNMRTGEVTKVEANLANSSPADGVYDGVVGTLSDAWTAALKGFMSAVIHTDGTVTTLDSGDPRVISTWIYGGQENFGTNTGDSGTNTGDSSTSAHEITGTFDNARCLLTLDGKEISLASADIGAADATPTCHAVSEFNEASADGKVLVATGFSPADERGEYLLIDTQAGKVVWRHLYFGGMAVARSDLFVTADDDGVVGWAPAK